VSLSERAAFYPVSGQQVCSFYFLRVFGEVQELAGLRVILAADLPPFEPFEFGHFLPAVLGIPAAPRRCIWVPRGQVHRQHR
jgi:hypothetical protein